MSNINNNNNMYIYQLPHAERKELCRILDQNKSWEDLGGNYMQYEVSTIQALRSEIFKGNSPTDELLTMWSHQNHTIVELFILLSRMQHYQAMSVIKNFVDKKYHVLLEEGEENISRLLENLTLRNKRPSKATPVNKNLAIPQANYHNEEKILNIESKVNNVRKYPQINVNPPDIISRENNETLIQDNGRLLQPKSPSPSPFGRLGTTLMSDISCVAESAGPIPQISYEELQTATNNWDPAAILGKGGFGTVFKGIWKCTEVAIKRIEQRENDPESHSVQIKQSITELQCLNACRHDNVLPLYGYSITGAQPCLIYQYMPGGSLEKRLKTKDEEKTLSWPKRLNIAIGTARGLQFLHRMGDKPLIHGDIKPANILLDLNDEAKIGDFGLAREGPQAKYTHMTVTKIHGTRPYLPDEFLRAKKISTKVDTYSFGIVLFEISTALSVYSDQYKFLKDHVVDYSGDIIELKDGTVEGGEACFRGLIDVGKLCVCKKAKDRPEMVTVFELLKNIKI